MTILRIVTDLKLTSLESIQTKIGSNRTVNKSKITFSSMVAKFLKL